jgi:hypothetical protein
MLANLEVFEIVVAKRLVFKFTNHPIIRVIVIKLVIEQESKLMLRIDQTYSVVANLAKSSLAIKQAILPTPLGCHSSVSNSSLD